MPFLIKRPIAEPDALMTGFTLIELLAVMAIIAILALVAAPMISSLQNAGSFSKSLGDISDSFNFARTYAIAQNTYVFVGLEEVDRTVSPSVSPQLNSLTGGRVALTIVASKDGTNGIAQTSWTSNYNLGANLIQLRTLQSFDFLHLTSGFSNPTTGNMARPDQAPVLLSQFSANPFSVPLGSALAGGKYNFTTVIAFNPQGSILLNGSAVQWIEIDLQPTKGNSIPSVPANVNQGNQAALVIDGVTGATMIYRP